MTVKTLYPTQQYFRVRNLEKYQRYRTRGNSWVQVHCCILDDPDFTNLPDREKFCAIGLIILAIRNENCLRMDPVWIQNRLSLRRVPKLNLLIDNGFIEYLAQPLHTVGKYVGRYVSTPKPPKGAGECQSPKPTRQKPVSAEAKELVSAFEQISGWKANAAAFRSCQKRIESGETDDMRRAATAYAAEIKESNPDKQYRKRPHNWFGRDAAYQSWLPVENKLVPVKEDPKEVEYHRLQRKYRNEPEPEGKYTPPHEWEIMVDQRMEREHPKLVRYVHELWRKRREA